MSATPRKPLCLIPARGGTKRLAGKNVAPLAGKPLLRWTIDCARDSGTFDAVLVSSDDAGMLEAAGNWGAVPVPRRAELATDTTTLLQVCLAIVPELAAKYGATDLYLLLPTSPLRTPETVRQAWRAFLDSGCDALLSLVPLEPPQWALQLRNGQVEPMYPEDYERPRQHLTEAFKHDGGHLIVNVDALVRNRSYMAGSVCPFFSPERETVDVNTQRDLLWAEFLLQNKAE